MFLLKIVMCILKLMAKFIGYFIKLVMIGKFLNLGLGRGDLELYLIL